MQTYPLIEREHFSNGSNFELEANANFALDLALYLQAEQHGAGYWPGNSVSSKLRYTCHTVEALHLIGWSPLQRCVDAGLHWLTNLAENIDLHEEDPQIALLHQLPD